MSCDKKLLAKARGWLRVTHNRLDEELYDTVEAAKLDLGIAGVYEVTDALYVQAIKLYVRWQYNWQGDGERYGREYFAMKCAMGLCGDYAEDEE